MNANDPFGLVGQVLDGQFRVDGLVGEGSFGVVYRGHHLGLDEPVAIKCLKLPAGVGASLVDTFIQRFRDESRILYRLSQGNLNIVRSMAAGTHLSPRGVLVPYMVLEWLDGRSLAQDFEERRKRGLRGRTMEELGELFEGACDALGYAHAQGVVHRDLNPGNVFLVRQGAAQRTKVLDFGVAKVLHDSTLELGQRAATIGNLRIFSPAYGAPEQFDNAIGPVGTWTDVYAVAIILLEALRDQDVFDADNLGDYARRVLDRGSRPTPRSLGIPVSDEVEAVFRRATALEPGARFASCGELWAALREAAGEEQPTRIGQQLSSLASHSSHKVPVSPLMRTLPFGSAGAAEVLARAPAASPTSAAGVASAAPRVPSLADLDVPETERVDLEEDADATRVAPAPFPIEPPQAPAFAGPSAAPVPRPLDRTTGLGEAFPAAALATAGTAPFVPPLAPTGPAPTGAYGAPPGPAGYGSASGMPAHFGTAAAGAPGARDHHQAGAEAALLAQQRAAATMQVRAFDAGGAMAAGRPPMWLIALAIGGALVVLGGMGVLASVVLSRGEPAHGADAAPSASPPPPSAPATVPPPVPVPPPPVTTAAPEPPPPPPATAAEDPPPPATAPVPVAPPPTAAPVPPAPVSPVPVQPATTGAPAQTAAPKPAADPNAFDTKAARAALDRASSMLAFCKKDGSVTGPGSANVAFANDGTVSSVVVDVPYADTPQGACVVGQFKRQKTAPFQGPPGYIAGYKFTVPK